jgi:hypothetical protein
VVVTLKRLPTDWELDNGRASRALLDEFKLTATSFAPNEKKRMVQTNIDVSIVTYRWKAMGFLRNSRKKRGSIDVELEAMLASYCALCINWLKLLLYL